MSSSTLIIGAGGVGNVVAHKCAQVPEVFGPIILASRTISKCNDIATAVGKATGVEIEVAAVDADNIGATADLIRQTNAEVVINVALPYQDLSIMEACLQAGAHYLDTANYEPIEDAKFEYKWQWAYQERFREAGLTALLGSGFDPGVTNVFCAHGQKHLFDEIHSIDILDANAGDHGHPFATNFNPEINIREISARGRYWDRGEWQETDPLSWSMKFDFPELGERKVYLLYHEELESLCRNLRGLKRIRFWMTFSENYLNHLRVLENIGMTSIKPVPFDGQLVVPLKFLKSVLPDPASLGPRTRGKTNIGCVMEGLKDGDLVRHYLYNICDHEECYREVGSQAVSYTTGVPAMIGARLILEGPWREPGVWNMEQRDPDPFMEYLNQHGLPWRHERLDADRPMPHR